VSLPVATVISRMDSLEVLRKNIAVVDDFVPLGGGEIDAWRRLSPRAKADRVIDWRRVRAEALLPLRSGVAARWHPFDWETMDGLAPEPVTVQPAPIVILDGAYSARPELADLVSLSILVTLPDAVRRLELREGDEVASEWQAIWDEAEEYYFGIVRPPEAFDVVIERPGTPSPGHCAEPTDG
jgi:uridine kinase